MLDYDEVWICKFNIPDTHSNPEQRMFTKGKGYRVKFDDYFSYIIIDNFHHKHMEPKWWLEKYFRRFT